MKRKKTWIDYACEAVTKNRLKRSSHRQKQTYQKGENNNGSY